LDGFLSSPDSGFLSFFFFGVFFEPLPFFIGQSVVA
jgi:hypothetical protein